MVFIGLNEFLKFGILGIFGLNLKTGTSQKKNVPQLIQVYIYIHIIDRERPIQLNRKFQQLVVQTFFGIYRPLVLLRFSK